MIRFTMVLGVFSLTLLLLSCGGGEGTGGAPIVIVKAPIDFRVVDNSDTQIDLAWNYSEQVPDLCFIARQPVADTSEPEFIELSADNKVYQDRGVATTDGGFGAIVSGDLYTYSLKCSRGEVESTIVTVVVEAGFGR